MGSNNMELEYMEKPFGGFCPFCLRGKNRWTSKRVLFKRIKYTCSICGAEVVVKMDDVLSGNYNSAKILINGTGKLGKVYESVEGRWIPFQKFYGRSILSRNYHRVKSVAGEDEYTPSCSLCKYGESASDGEGIQCGIFEFVGELDWICDCYVSDMAEIADLITDLNRK